MAPRNARKTRLAALAILLTLIATFAHVPQEDCPTAIPQNDETAIELATEYGVGLDVRRSRCGDLYEFYTVVHTERFTLLISESNLLAAALEAAKDNLVAEIETTYRIDIVQEESIRVSSGSVQARDPSLSELVVLKLALSLSQPSNLAAEHADGKMLSILFADEPTRQALGLYYRNVVRDGGEGPLIILTSYQIERTNEQRFETIMHELAHNAHTTAFSSNDDAESYYRDLAWEEISRQRWAIRGTDGRLFMRFANLPGRPWISVNDQGHMLDENGERVRNHSEAYAYSNREMHQAAELTPASTYFDTPREMIAEGLVEFRASQLRRGELLRCNPRLYAVIKRLDQDEIDTQFSNFAVIRNTDGRLVENTDKNRAEVERFEENASRFSMICA